MANSANGAAYDTSYLATIDPMPSPFPQTAPLSAETPGKTTARPKKKTAEQLKSENRARMILFIKAVTVIGLLVAMLCGELSQHVALADVNRQVRAEQGAVTLLKSENAKLKARLKAKYSDEEIERYAVGKLGMIKLEKKIPIELSRDDCAITDTEQ
ncbi:MAG TPA: hypothetical protein PL044_09325 [Clostridiales bacterium]|nr:MAG: Cell division protein FtsL [Firmicutes bacterium ADurb.Bin262]HOU10692.1 hypothetical protein [Clostridiales bacterium]HQH62979.1 hypothetical protein [Clostridiales bacterium]HQK73953.1 hypothetical protein [Clostridiales bacterium]